MRREKLLWKKKWTQFMKASSFTKWPLNLCLFKQGYDVQVLLSSVMYILSGENITAVYTMSRRRWDQNTTQVANRLDWARAIYVWLLHLTPWSYLPYSYISAILLNAGLSGIGIIVPLSVPECHGTGLRCWMPKNRCRRHRPRCRCPALLMCTARPCQKN